MDISLNKIDGDIAFYIYEKFKNLFKCSSIKKSIWYYFNNNKWVYNDSGNELKKKILTEIVEDYTKYSFLCNKKAGKIYGDEPDKETWCWKGLKAREISIKLKGLRFSNSVFTQCQKLFFDENFEDKLKL